MTRQFLSVTLDGRSEHDIKSVARLRSAVIDQMECFVNCKRINKSVFENDDALEIQPDPKNGRFDFTYAGTRIQFAVVAGLASDGPSAKIRCTHEYEIAANKISDLLGDFNLEPNGRMNFHEPSGQVCFAAHTADLIVAFYLAKAFENNLRVE